MFEEKIEQCLPRTDAHREEQVGMDLMKELGRTVSVGQSMLATMTGGRWLLKNAVACSGWEKTALKNPSFVWTAGVRRSSVSSTGKRIGYGFCRGKDKYGNGQAARNLLMIYVCHNLFSAPSFSMAFRLCSRTWVIFSVYFRRLIKGGKRWLYQSNGTP
jgi:hypothetical protein